MAIVIYIPNGADGKIVELANTLTEIRRYCGCEAGFKTVSAAARIVYDLDAQIGANFETMSKCAKANAEDEVQEFASDMLDATVLLRQKAHELLAAYLTAETGGELRLASYSDHTALAGRL